MAAGKDGIERRKQRRFPVELPLSYKIGKKTFIGSTVNACDEGIMVESYLSPKGALSVFKILEKSPDYRMGVTFSYEGNIDRRDAEIKHFHLDSVGNEAYRFTVGFWLPKTSQSRLTPSM
ncbi:MAG: hypothetical protein GTN81_12080 [Proteobacteria bacterium]|nr:hypothetical protein [Pseudomonadota bacterium]